MEDFFVLLTHPFLHVCIISYPMPPFSLLDRVSLFCLFSSKVSSFFETFPYRLDESTGQIDYDTMAANAKLFRPKVGKRRIISQDRCNFKSVLS